MPAAFNINTTCIISKQVGFIVLIDLPIYMTYKYINTAYELWDVCELYMRIHFRCSTNRWLRWMCWATYHTTTRSTKHKCMIHVQRKEQQHASAATAKYAPGRKIKKYFPRKQFRLNNLSISSFILSARVVPCTAEPAQLHSFTQSCSHYIYYIACDVCVCVCDVFLSVCVCFIAHCSTGAVVHDMPELYVCDCSLCANLSRIFWHLSMCSSLSSLIRICTFVILSCWNRELQNLVHRRYS